MVFSSITFLVYFLPLVLVLYFILPHKFKNIFLLIASIFFYSWGAPKFIFIILATTLVDFYLVRTMFYSESQNKKKLFLILSLCLNVGLLFYFKYCNFFIDNANHILSLFTDKQFHLLNVILPIGISFYTFESLTYVIDVYRGVHKPLNNFWNYQLYIILFPKLIAGPIIRYNEIADQITDRSATDNNDNRLAGFRRFIIGLSKKVFIANVMAIKADEVFAMPTEELNAGIAWIGTLSYTFQIYFDFSGYSDMAIGLGKMFGFKFPENFDNPYTSKSITEFWRRWHITLGNWMRNYLYIPLGGNKTNNRARLFFNLWIVFLASGFWHGAAWTFIIWGVYHGTFLVLERLFLGKVLQKSGAFVSIVFTFLIVNIGWVIFRSETITQAGEIVSKLFTFDFTLPVFFIDDYFIFYFVLAILFSFLACFKIGKLIQTKIFSDQITVGGLFGTTIICLCLFVLSLASISSGEFNPFIYFRF